MTTEENKVPNGSSPGKSNARKLSASDNWLSFLGLIVIVGSIFAFLLLFAIDIISGHANPYMGILAYIGSPTFLFIGGAMWIAGWFIHRKQIANSKGKPTVLSVSLDLSEPKDRVKFMLFVMSGIAFLMLTALGSYQTYHYTESVEFCGEICHTVMEPEYTTYLNSPHARVSCVECHIGSGVNWYVKSKISGLHQVYAVLADDFQKPIDTPISNLRPAQYTCEQCHWPQKFVGNLDRTFVHYLSDVENTPHEVRMLLKVGGSDPKHGPPGGIHWHTNPDNKVEFITTDEDELVIPWVRVTNASGKETVYQDGDFEMQEGMISRAQTMDCMDCHNRPAHIYETPNESIDHAIYLGKLNRELEDLKFNTVDLLTMEYESKAEALEAIAEGLTDYYPDDPRLQSTIEVVQEIYSRTFFPEMKANWSLYPEHIGHKDWPGCFRCHDGKHLNFDSGAAIPVTASECNACHTIIAQGDSIDPASIRYGGMEYQHPAEISEGLLCSDCHNGAIQ